MAQSFERIALAELARRGRLMRDAQASFFKNRGRAELEASKRAERDFDRALADADRVLALQPVAG